MTLTMLVDLLLSSKWRAGKAYSSEDEDRLRNEIASKVHGQELSIALAAFPFKIANPLKTVGEEPDWGERKQEEDLP